MGLFDQTKSQAGKRENFTFQTIPANVEELKALPVSDLSTPFKTCALTLLALLNYEKDVNATIEMPNFLKGPAPMSEYEKQFLKDRLNGKEYVVRSYLDRANRDNNYIPAEPLKITIYDNPYSYREDGWATLHMDSSGADSPRQIKCRLKPSTNQWFLVENMALSDIRIPKEADPWA